MSYRVGGGPTLPPEDAEATDRAFAYAARLCAIGAALAFAVFAYRCATVIARGLS